MKQLTRLTGLVLSIVMLFGIAGCGAESAPTTAPTQAATSPTISEPTAEELYRSAVAVLESSTLLSLDITTVRTAVVGEQTFSETIEQTLTYSGQQYASTESIDYGQSELHTYSEVYEGETLYIDVDGTCFSGALTDTEAASRHLPASLLDAARYSRISSRENGADTEILFEEPLGAEVWAMPEDAQLVDACGSVLIDESGALRQMQYTITYRYVSAVYTVEVTARPRTQAEEIPQIADASIYTPITSVDAPRMALGAVDLLKQSDSVSTFCDQTVMSAILSVIEENRVAIDLYRDGEELTGKFEARVLQVTEDEGLREGQALATFQDGVYTVNGEVTEQPAAHLLDTCYQQIDSYIVVPQYWQDAVCTDMGSINLIEIETNHAFIGWIEELISTQYYGDATILSSKFDSRNVNTVSAYLSVDKFSGLPIGSGLHYDADYLYERVEYNMSVLMDQKINGVSPYSYYNVTLEYPEDEIPEGDITPLFYSVTGENGQKMWLLPSNSAGDARMTVLPQEIMDAFHNADMVMLGSDGEAYLIEGSAIESESRDTLNEYFWYNNSSSSADHMDPQTYERLSQYLKATGQNLHGYLDLLVPLFQQSIISGTYLNQAAPLSVNYGTDYWFGALSHRQGKEIRTVVDSLELTKNYLTLPIDVQVYLLKDTMNADAEEYIQSLYDTYELWCEGDETKLRELIGDPQDWDAMPEEYRILFEPYYQNYLDWYEQVFEKAEQCLEGGEEVFFVVDLDACLTEELGLVDRLRAAGYTVELVQYAE